jgi:hypothetical protein
MNSGTFYMEFDYKALTYTVDTVPVYTADGPTKYGFMFYKGANLTFYWCNGSGSYGMARAFAVVLGTSYNIKVYGDGTQIRILVTNLETNAITYDSGLVSCTYVPNATTSFALRFGYGNHQCQIKNFKIFTDTAGTVPFMYLPLQDAPTLMTDRVTGLVGTATAVSIINNNQNALRNKNLWANFDINGYSTIGTTSTLGWMNSGIFKLEFDFTLLTTPVANTAIINTGDGTTQRGFRFYPRTSNTMLFYWCNGSGAYGATIVPANNILNLDLHYELFGNGTQIQLVITDNDSKTVIYNSDWVACTYIVNATTTAALTIQRTAVDANRVNFLIKNFKVFTDIDGTIPFMHLPLTDGGNIVKDVVGGLQGTIYGTIKIVEI